MSRSNRGTLSERVIRADLEFLPAGDALLTRRAKAKSKRNTVLVRFSRNRKRYERQGLLVEPDALAEAQRERGERARLP